MRFHNFNHLIFYSQTFNRDRKRMNKQVVSKENIKLKIASRHCTKKIQLNWWKKGIHSFTVTPKYKRVIDKEKVVCQRTQS